MLIRVEPKSLLSRPLQGQGGTTTSTQLTIFNEGLAIPDEGGTHVPDLATALPRLNTESWTVSPDGTMETTYTLKPNLTWHDGAPLTADDFVFAWHVFASPSFGVAASPPFSSMDEIVAPDPSTVLIRWKRPYANAGTLLHTDFTALPSHILGQPFQGTPDTFLANPFWTTGYVGLGPFKLDAWQPGAFMEATAFDGFVRGKPKIGRIRLTWSGDPNVALASVLAGDVDVSADDSLRPRSVSELKQQWTAGQGAVLGGPTLYRASQVQLRPEYVSPKALLDVRVRRALAYATNKQAINDTVFEGNGLVADQLIPPNVPYFADVDRAITKYPFDPQRAAQLMGEAGYGKGADGFYAGPSEGRLSFEIKTNAGADFEAEMSVLGSTWRTAGFDFSEAVNPAALVGDAQVRATFPSVFTSSSGQGEDALPGYATVPGPDNRWQGFNRGGWNNQDFLDLGAQFSTTLDRDQRNQQVIRMMQIYADQVPWISLYFDMSFFAYVGALHGPVPGVNVNAAEALYGLEKWELQ